MAGRHRVALGALVLGAMGMTGCVVAAPPVEVTRFHADSVAQQGSIALVPLDGIDGQSIEFRTYANAVSAELRKIGFTPTDSGAGGDYVARIGFIRDVRLPVEQRRSPVSVGVGGSTGSYGSGVGLGIGINLSGKPKPQIATELSVQIRNRATDAAIWEGRAQTIAKEGSPAAQTGIVAGKLAAALFRGFPGQSGETIRVK